MKMKKRVKRRKKVKVSEVVKSSGKNPACMQFFNGSTIMMTRCEENWIFFLWSLCHCLPYGSDISREQNFAVEYL